MEQYFERSLFRKCFYGSILAAWISINIGFNLHEVGFSVANPFGIVNLYFFLLPALILVLQMFYNSFVGWFLSILLSGTFAFYAFVVTISEMITTSYDYNFDNLSVFFLQLLIFTFLAFIVYILFRVRPQEV